MFLSSSLGGIIFESRCYLRVSVKSSSLVIVIYNFKSSVVKEINLKSVVDLLACTKHFACSKPCKGVVNLGEVAVNLGEEPGKKENSGQEQ